MAKTVPEDAQATARPKDRSRLHGTADGVDPVPRLSCGQDVERVTPVIPVLEPRDLDGQAVRLRDLGHPRVRFDADNRAAALDEEPCDDPGSAADVNDVASVVRNEVLEERRGITRASTVVLGSVLAE